MSFCTNCGTQLPDGTEYCSYCGAAQANAAGSAMNQQLPIYQKPIQTASTTLTGPAKTLGLISMICGLVSLVSCWGGFVPAIAALILAKIAGNKAPGVSNPKARVGKITAIVGIVLASLSLVFYVWSVVANVGFAEYGYYESF